MNYFFTVFLVLVFLFLLNFILPHLAKLYWKKRNLKLMESSGKIFLTFDDGPDETCTTEILNTLKEYNIKATFFVVGERAERNSSLIERMIKEGHAIGLHGNKHVHPWKSNPWKAMDDLREGQKALQNLGVRANYLRPPYGKINFFSFMYVLYNRFIFVHWNADLHDYKETVPENLKSKLDKEVTAGKVVLLHDGRAQGAKPNKVTSEGLRLFLQNMKTDKSLFATIAAVL